MVGWICTKFGDSNQNTSRLVHVKLCAMWCRFVLVRAKRLGGSLFWDTLYIYTVRHKKLHPSYWYNNFAKLCHAVTIFGKRISYRLPV